MAVAMGARQLAVEHQARVRPLQDAGLLVDRLHVVDHALLLLALRFLLAAGPAEPVGDQAGREQPERRDQPRHQSR